MAEESFAQLLRRLRISVGLTQEELAHRSTVSTRSISDLERAIYRTARKETARLLADALELSGTTRELFETTARGKATDPALSAVLSLPVPLTPLVGRESEIATVCSRSSARTYGCSPSPASAGSARPASAWPPRNACPPTSPTACSSPT